MSNQPKNVVLTNQNHQGCTRQRIFNVGYAGILNQGEKAEFLGVPAYYTRKDGKDLYCPIGHCIKIHDDYSLRSGWFDEYSVASFPVIDSLREHDYDVEVEDGEFLLDFQNAHDTLKAGPDFIENFKILCYALATTYNLTIPDLRTPLQIETERILNESLPTIV